MKFLNNIEVGESPNFTLPLTDGTSGQVLSTNGTGTVSWSSLAGVNGTNLWTALADTHTGSGVGVTLQGSTTAVPELIFEGTNGISTQTDSTDGKVIIDGSGISTYADWKAVDGSNNVADITNGIYLKFANSTSSGSGTSGDPYVLTISGGSGDLVDVDTNVTDNVIAIYGGSANTIDYASESATSASTNFRVMADGNELSICNDIWAERATGGVSPKYFMHLNPSGAGTVRSAIYGTGAEVISIKSAQTAAWTAVRNANNAALDVVGHGMRTDSSEGDIYIEGRKGATAEKTFAIESISTGANADRLHVINYGDNHFRFANAVSDQPYMFYWGNGTAWANVTNEFTTLGVRIDPTSIAVDGTNNPSTPNFRFLDDGDTGMYLAANGQTAFSSGGNKVMSVPTTQGTNGQVLTTDGSGTCSWTTVSGGGSYTAGAGLDLTGSAFSLERDLQVDVDKIGSSVNDYIEFDAATGTRMDFYVNGAIAGAFRNDGAPELHCDGDIIAYSSTISDARLKEDIQDIENASEKVAALRGVEYTWKRGGRKGQREIGFIAQEVEAVVPQIVREKQLPLLDGGLDDSSTSYKTVDYEKIIALLVESNKELQARITELESKIK
jgi:hypothetical protein